MTVFVVQRILNDMSTFMCICKDKNTAIKIAEKNIKDYKWTDFREVNKDNDKTYIRNSLNSLNIEYIEIVEWHVL